MVLCAGLTPAWQHVVSVDRLDHGGVNRTRANQWCASGKAINAAVTDTCGPAVLDARGEELLCALERRPLVIKPNRTELAATLGRPLGDEPALRQAIKEMHDRGAQWVVVTDGPHAVHVSGDGAVIILEPRAAEIVNPIGSGDALAAGLAAGLCTGKSIPEAVEGGIAAATRNLGNPLPGRLDALDVAPVQIDKTEG